MILTGTHSRERGIGYNMFCNEALSKDDYRSVE